MLLECTECELPFYHWEDLQEHYAITHPELDHLDHRLDVRIAKRILNLHQKTYRCPRCYMPFPHPDLRDSHVEFDECDVEDSDCEREPGTYGTLRRGRVDSLMNKISKLRKRRGSASSSNTPAP
ncbi:hypothetical protein GGX14DRAFT_573894 [Mycena pura]|uniref:C2H2-type domain-containing protein n=1 Tax=Mycena pura TaxID=153505 RepID=A0AAD6V261_9AGAR|nr:hypothetical protein GGX14DRAFT_573894 [Mycena pura]